MFVRNKFTNRFTNVGALLVITTGSDFNLLVNVSTRLVSIATVLILFEADFGVWVIMCIISVCGDDSRGREGEKQSCC